MVSTSHMRHGQVEPYSKVVQSRKPKVKKKKKTPKSDAQSPKHLNRKLKKIVMTREFHTRSEHNPETPPRNSLGGVQVSRSAARRRSSTMNFPWPPLPSFLASTVPRSPTQTTIYGLQFREDPRFHRWHRSLLNEADTASIGAFENDIGAQQRVPPYEPVPKELGSGSGDPQPIITATNLGAEHPNVPLEMPHRSADSPSDGYKRLSCTPIQFQSMGIGRSASLLKARIAQKVWVGRSIKARLRSSNPEELAQVQEPGRTAIPRQITIGRRLRSQKKSENLRVRGAMGGEATQSHNTLRLVDADEEPQFRKNVRDPELEAMLHDPNQKRFSDEWGKFVKSQIQGEGGENGPLPANEVFVSHEPPDSMAVLAPFETTRSLANGAESEAGAKDQVHTPLNSPDLMSDPNDARTKPASPTITTNGDEARRLIPPSPGPRTSSKQGIFAKFMPGKIPPPVPPVIGPCPVLNRSRPSNISRPRKASESSLTADNDSTNPAHSTDTLAQIEVELQVSPARPAHVDIGERPTRSTKNLSIDSGPSGSAPTKELPQLPNVASERSGSRGSSRNRHTRKQSSISLNHAKSNRSGSSLSTVRGISPSTNARSESHTQGDAWKVHANAPQSVASKQCLVTVPLEHSTLTSEAMRTPTSVYSQDYRLPAPTETFQRKQAQKEARAESRKLMKRRDLASHAAIVEENESDTAFVTHVDQLEQFPKPPCSRSGSRGSTRRARSTQRSQSTTRRPAPLGFARQLLASSGVMVVAEASPAAPKLKGNHHPTSNKGSPLREISTASVYYNPKDALLKKASSRSIRSHRSNSVLAVNGEHTPPSSDPSASDEQISTVLPYRTTLHCEIEDIKAMIMTQARTIDKLQNTIRLYLPTSRSRSRDVSQDHQLTLGPSSFRYPRRAISNVSTTTAASDTGPGPAFIADEGVGYDFGGGILWNRRLSGAPVAVKMDSIVDQTFVGLP